MVSQAVDKIILAEKQVVKMTDEAYKKSEQIISDANEKAKEIIDKANSDIEAEIDNLMQNNDIKINEIFEKNEKLTAAKVSEIRNTAQLKKEKAIDVVISRVLSK